MIRGATCSLVGDLTRSSLSRLKADFAIIGADWISASTGAITDSTEEADIIRQMIENTQVGVVCVVDETKWETHAGHVAAEINELSVVVSEKVPHRERLSMESHGILIIDAADPNNQLKEFEQ